MCIPIQIEVYVLVKVVEIQEGIFFLLKKKNR